MDPDDIERRRRLPPAGPGYDPESVDAHLRRVADQLDDRPEADVERAARDMLGKLDTLQVELDRLLGGLKATAEQLGGSLRAFAPDAAALELPSAPPADGASRSEDEAGARLVARTMAREGAPRAETGRFLAAHYALADLDGLLDDVYASAGP